MGGLLEADDSGDVPGWVQKKNRAGEWVMLMMREEEENEVEGGG